MTKRVVITGVGAVSPCASDAEATWQALLAGKSGIGPITLFDASEHPSKIAGECSDFNPENWIEKRRLREMARFIHMAVAASDMAVKAAGFDPSDAEKEHVGTLIGVGMCGLELIEASCKTLFDRGPKKVSPYFIPSSITNLAPGQVSMRFGFKGPSYTTTSACSSGAHAIGEALRWIQRGHMLAAVAGGAEASATALGVAGFTAMKALSTRNDAPEKASRPFDKDRDGFVIAEGAGIVILEELEYAKKRGANIIAEVIGYGATADAYHLTQPAPEGEGAQRSMREAIADAKLNPTDVDYINAHGTSTGVGDVNETKAIKAVFGDHVSNGLWVSSTKSMTGHLLGAAGGLETVISALSIRDGAVPPTINLDAIEPECAGVDFVPHEARKREVKIALTNSFGFGGTNATLVLKQYQS
ncbi:MAG: beta-ketoacyl-ACP synthase II [Myxococcales bacterium]|nr:MAG: beta-ketoacyl-ACP synthase II [Myxococcales bacterium]